ncbi:MAG: hypothetical protein AAGD35_21425 [Actinomycetota bacterium]
MTSATLVVVCGVIAGFTALAVGDARSRLVPVLGAQAVTVVAAVGVGVVAVIERRWWALAAAAAGAAFVFAVQAVPLVLGRRFGERWMGRADVRLALPFGWTLGFLGLGFVVIGFATANLAGLAMAGITRRRRIPFVPFLAVGLVVAALWAGLAGAP